MYTIIKTAFLVQLLSTSTLAAVIQTCTWKNGQVADGYIPCTNSTATTGNCCHSGDACTESGMCYGGVGLVYRGACINQWGGDCLTYCDDIADEWANFFPCAYAGSGSTFGPQSWWCGAKGTEMCTQTNGTHIITMAPGGPKKIAGQTLAATSSATGTSTPGSSSATTTSSSSVAPAANASVATDKSANLKSESGNNGAMIGLGIVLGLLVLMCIVGGVWGFRMYRQQQKRLEMMIQAHKEGTDTSRQVVYQPHQRYEYQPEMPARNSLLKVEMDGRGQVQPVELGGHVPERY